MFFAHLSSRAFMATDLTGSLAFTLFAVPALDKAIGIGVNDNV